MDTRIPSKLVRKEEVEHAKKKLNLEVGDLVLLADKSFPRGK